MIIPDYTFLIQWFNFLLLIYLLNRFLFRPILNRMDERNRKIRGNLDDAAADRAAAEKRMTAYEEAIAAARRQGMEEVLEMERQVSAEMRRVMDEKRTEAESLTEEARVSIEDQTRELATEAAIACRDFAFAQLNRNRVISWMSLENFASRRVAEKVGMTLERETKNKSGFPRVVYSMTPDELS